MLCRRRDRTDWRDTPVDAVFAHTDEQHLIRIRDLALRVKSQVRETLYLMGYTYYMNDLAIRVKSQVRETCVIHMIFNDLFGRLILHNKALTHDVHPIISL